jgi:lipoate synthase
VFAVGELVRANGELRTEAADLKRRIDVLEEEEKQRLLSANEAVKRDIREELKAKNDLTNLEQELAKLKEETDRMKNDKSVPSVCEEREYPNRRESMENKKT